MENANSLFGSKSLPFKILNNIDWYKKVMINFKLTLKSVIFSLLCLTFSRLVEDTELVICLGLDQLKIGWRKNRHSHLQNFLIKYFKHMIG
jgi:hypothetical protein